MRFPRSREYHQDHYSLGIHLCKTESLVPRKIRPYKSELLVLEGFARSSRNVLLAQPAARTAGRERRRQREISAGSSRAPYLSKSHRTDAIPRSTFYFRKREVSLTHSLPLFLSLSHSFLLSFFLLSPSRHGYWYLSLFLFLAFSLSPSLAL